MNKKDRLSKDLLKIGELAKVSGVPQGTVRHYANLGLIEPAEMMAGGFRLFEKKKALERIGMIKKLLSKGNTLEEIRNANFSETMTKEVLVVDDDVEVSDLIKDILKDNKSVKIKTAFDGFIAGRMLDEYVPDLIILDLNLPGMDGFKVCENVRSDIRYNATRILAITGYDSPESERKILSAGSDAYIAKPFDIKKLADTIRKLL